MGLEAMSEESIDVISGLVRSWRMAADTVGSFEESARGIVEAHQEKASDPSLDEDERREAQEELSLAVSLHALVEKIENQIHGEVCQKIERLT